MLYISSYERQEEFALFIISFLQYIKSIWPSHEQEQKLSPVSTPMHIEKILAWIEENYATEFHLEMLSNELHLSPYYISHMFQQLTGTTITEYLIARRIRQACWLLRNSTMPVYHICLQVGLTNVSYFCKKFKEHTGRTPLQYRTGGAG